MCKKDNRFIDQSIHQRYVFRSYIIVSALAFNYGKVATDCLSEASENINELFIVVTRSLTVSVRVI